MAIASNAFNFGSFVQSNVDPRTGQFTLSIELPVLHANELCGPDLPLRLTFNPLNEQDAGLGIGWSLKLSRYSLTSNMLELHTGESLKVYDNGPGQTPVIPEQKLKSFNFKNISDDDTKRYRVAHQSGLIEVLEPQPSDPTMALPVRILSHTGHGIRLEYTHEAKPRLWKIHDDHRTLLSIDYENAIRPKLDIHPGTEAFARFALKLDNDELRTIILPDDTRWELTYQRYGKLRFITQLQNPGGGRESVTYKEKGHQFPGIARYLPYVREHVVKPDPFDEKSFIHTCYSYTPENFLGNGTGITWNDDLGDNLYEFTGSDFEYGSTASHYLDGKVLRTVESTFNRFHLLRKQVTCQEGCIDTVETLYHEVDNARFPDQPAHFQLPREVRRVWTLRDDPRLRQEEVATMTYDEHGNLLEERLANGMRMVREYYTNDENDDCPDDPEGFVRSVKSLTVYPAPTASTEGAPAQTVTTRYRYVKLPALAQQDPNLKLGGWLAIEQEELIELQGEGEGKTERVLSCTHRRYLHKPDNPFLHGRLDQQTVTIDGTSSTSRWRYQRVEDDADKLTWSQSTETFSAPCGTVEKTTSRKHSLHTGLLVEEEDPNGIAIRHHYDVLGRLVEQTTATGMPEQATRRFAYRLLTENGRTYACEETTDVNGVLTRTVYDGSGRPLRRERDTQEGEDAKVVTRKVSDSQYDSIGRLVGETFHDYLPPEEDSPTQQERILSMPYTYAYDGWGQRCEVTRPDGVKERTDTSPFGIDGQRIAHWQESPENPGQRLQLNVSELNRFGKPIHHYRLIEEDGKAPRQVGRTDYAYDGLGRCIRETLTLDDTPQRKAIERTKRYTYDALGRMFETQRADGSILTRHFAKHSLGELTTLLQVRAGEDAPSKTVCKRGYDGLGRLTRLSVGPRIETYGYKAATSLMETRTAYTLQPTDNRTRKRVITYKYRPELTEQPSQVTASIEGGNQPLASETAVFGYDTRTAGISSAKNDLGERIYRYDALGQLTEECWIGNQGIPSYETQYRHSQQGRALYRKHNDGVACTYTYDDHGRVSSVRQGTLQSTLTYNAQGLLHSAHTQDTASQQQALCTLQYDALGRETTRTLSANGQQQTLTLDWQDNDMLRARTLSREGRQVRRETFGYDELDRLDAYDCEGEAPPGNARGRAISSQLFRFDELDNITRCVTHFVDGNKDDARFSYAPDGSFQLHEVTHTLLEDYPQQQAFRYDDQGNMLNDEYGRTLQYDSLGRLQRVIDTDGTSVLAEYLYDGHNQLTATLEGTRQSQRRFLDHRLESLLEDGALTQYLYAGGQPTAVQAASNTLLLTDSAGSVLTECDEDGVRHANYSVYGEQSCEVAGDTLRGMLAFNGEAREQALGWYLLGSGYRAYNPGLMRFHSPDSLPPEVSGINPYLYALANPVNWRDPTGHRARSIWRPDAPWSYIDPPEKPKIPWYAWIGVAVAFAVLVVSVISMPWTAPATIGITAGYIAGVAGVAANAAAAALQTMSVLTWADDPEMSNTLSNVAYGVGFLGMVLGGAGAAAVNQSLRAANQAQASGALASGANAGAKSTANVGVQVELGTSTARAATQSGGNIRATAVNLMDELPFPEGFETVTQTRTAASRVPVASTSQGIKPNPITQVKADVHPVPTVAKTTPKAHPIPNTGRGFGMDLTLLGDNHRFVFMRNLNTGRYEVVERSGTIPGAPK